MGVQHAGVLSLICNGNFQFVFPRTRRRGTIARAFSEKPIDAFFVFSPARRHARGFVRVRTGDGVVVFEERIIVIFKKYTSSVRGRPTSTSDAYVGDARGRRRRTTRAKTRETRTRVAVRGVGTPAGCDADGGQGGVS